jgi:hypothetical protein
MALGDGGHLGHLGRVIAQAQGEVVQALTEPSLDDAARSLERYHALAGTYADADVGGGLQLRLRWATDTGYCIESVGADGVQHLLGPGGSPAPGPCP